MPIDIGKACCAISNLGSNWDQCWEGLLQARRPFSVGSDVIPDWPVCPPISAILNFGHHDGQPAFSQRFAVLAECVGIEMKPVIDALLARSPELRISIIIASSAGDPGALSALVDAEFSPKGPSEPITGEVLTGLLGGDWAAPLNKALGRTFQAVGVFGACASSLVGMSYTADRINAGLSDVVLLVAMDTLSRFASIGFTNIGANAAGGSIPYDKARDGTTVGEGAICLLLARNGVLEAADVMGRVAGTAVYCDAAHMVEPNPVGVASVVTGAIEQAGLGAADIKGVYWHGTGTRQNDKTEAAVSSIVFGAMSPPCTSTKGSLGHTMGASGGFNLLSACKSFETGLMPPVAGTKDPEYDNLDLVLGQPREIALGPILVTALGFGGINSAAILLPPN
ncbi:beta-ketoacyl synthase N-terminal-like domain-containing protein [Ottowia sp.]|uniref:beta-ketoacyl synthase N-terminal-like domain-containing protein n=1 Tax=Ottowia sp. TaxID=1898956 RepID=UPI0025D17558|nr:beta-ketoacyl synthase N-terminal-like domain-containing protein [Ottowia sp.]MBK6616484.1 hypothetical protein [Ottowia sp.]